MVRVLDRKHRRKCEKQVRRHKKNENFAGRDATLPKDQKKLLTNKRLTVPHVQTGIFMKGKKSSTYHREEDVRFNMLNKARMDEKLNDILNLAKCSDRSNQEIILESVDDIHDIQTCLFPQEKEHNLNSSPNFLLKDQFERKKYQISQNLSEDISRTEELQKHTKQNIFEHPKLQSSKNREENFNESEYTNFKLFITYFDHISFDLTFTEDFIVREKLELKAKKQNKLSDHNSVNQFSNINEEETSTTDLAQHSEGEGIREETKTLKNTNSRIINKILKSKRNPNYNAFKNIKRIHIINTSQHRQKKHEPLENRNIFFKNSLPESSHKEFKFHTAEKPFSSKDKITFPEMNCCKTKSSLLNPLHYLNKSLSENYNYSLPSVSTKASSLDGFQFLKHSLSLSSSSAPPDLRVTERRNERSPFKQLSQPCKSLRENSVKGINQNFESFGIQKHTPSQLHIWKNNIKSYSKQSTSNNDFFEVHFDEEKKSCTTDEFQIRDFFTKDNSASKDLSDSDDCLSCHFSSQSHKLENLSPFLDKTIINLNNIMSPIYSKEVKKSSKPERPVLKNTMECCDIKSPCSLHVHKYNYLESKTLKNNISSIYNFQEEDVRANNFWHRRKMF